MDVNVIVEWPISKSGTKGNCKGSKPRDHGLLVRMMYNKAR